jgi:hypothetical protein
MSFSLFRRPARSKPESPKKHRQVQRANPAIPFQPGREIAELGEREREREREREASELMSGA